MDIVTPTIRLNCTTHLFSPFSPKYVRDPTVFRPERWLKPDRENMHPFLFLPFGHGARMCIGRRFAEQEISVLVTKMVRNFRVEWYGEDELGMLVNTITFPDSPLRFTLVDR